MATLQAWGLPETAWPAAQVVSELATNCTLHARTRFTVTLTVESRCLRIDAVDESPVALQARQHSATATTGRGLRMVEVLSTEWGVSPGDPGKTVWAVLAVDQADAADDDDAPVTGPGAHGGRAGAGPGRASATVAAVRDVA